MTSGPLYTVLIGVLLALGAMARQLDPWLRERKIRRLMATLPRPVPPPPPSWSPRARFDPIDAGDRRGSGYTGYTESFAASGTLRRYLGALADEDTRIATAAFACAYLQTRMHVRLSPEFTGEGAADEAGLNLDTSSALGWLAEIHGRYADNCPPDSSFVRYALESVVTDYARGRSLRLQREWHDLATKLLVEGMDVNERSARLDRHKETSDLDPAATGPLIVAAARIGRRLGESHEASVA